jgi:aryl-alcohol dehydrogenase-like predicted oxidoreductase
VIQKEPITSPIIGATKMSHLEDAVAALSITLEPEEIAYLEELYVPHSIIGFK